VLRLVGMLGSLIAYFCVGTVLAQGIVVGYIVMQGTVDKTKIVDMLAVAHGIELDPESELGDNIEQNSSEQVSLEEKARASAEVARDIELKSQHLLSSKAELAQIQNSLVIDRQEFDRHVTAFFDELKAEKEHAKKTAQLEVVSILQTAKPGQSKAQLMLMWERGEVDRVVDLMIAMPERSRKKIVDEFKGEQDAETLSEILKKIGEGGAIVNLVENTEENLEQDGIRRE